MVAQRPLLRRPQAPPGPRPLNHYDQHTFSTESEIRIRGLDSLAVEKNPALVLVDGGASRDMRGLEAGDQTLGGGQRFATARALQAGPGDGLRLLAIGVEPRQH